MGPWSQTPVFGPSFCLFLAVRPRASSSLWASVSASIKWGSNVALLWMSERTELGKHRPATVTYPHPGEGREDLGGGGDGNRKSQVGPVLSPVGAGAGLRAEPSLLCTRSLQTVGKLIPFRTVWSKRASCRRENVLDLQRTTTACACEHS